MSSNFDLLRKMLCIKLRQMGDTGMKPRVIDSLHSGLFDDYNLHPNLKWLDGMEKRQFPFSDWLNSTFQPIYEEMFSDSDAHQLAFDRFELTASLTYRTHADTSNDSRFWLPGGGYRYRYTNRQMIYAEIKASLEQDGDQSVYIQSQLLGTSAANVQA